MTKSEKLHAHVQKKKDVHDRKKVEIATQGESVAGDNVKTIIPEETRDIKYDLLWFKDNNWISINAKNNKAIKSLDSRGASIWLAKDGEIWLRINPNETPVKAPASRAKLVLGNMIGKKVKIISGGKEDDPVDISELDLLLVVKDIFDPFIREEFISSDNAYYRNTFQPTKFMKVIPHPLPEPRAILSLVRHLSGEHYLWVINWFAQFFQTLKKSQVSLVMRGTQGVGKGILWSEVITPLFGTEATIQVNDKALDTSFLGGIVEGRLFFNLDEISHDIAGNKKIKNFLKALVTNQSIITEKKHQNIEGETPLYGQVFITSNEPYVIEVEPEDRRFTVLMTGGKLPESNFLGHGSYEALSNALKRELPLFANYLKGYAVDTEWANTALETKEKTALIHATNDKFTMFADAIKKKDLLFFADIEEDSIITYNEIKTNFEKNRICQSRLTHYFKELFDEEVSSKKLMDRLRAINPTLFDNASITKSGGKKYFKIE